MMKKGVAALLLVVLIAALAHDAAADCSPAPLLPCLGAISGGQQPSAECCKRLKEQEPCFCQYIKNPIYAPYVNSPNAKKVAADCGVVIPTIC